MDDLSKPARVRTVTQGISPRQRAPLDDCRRSYETKGLVPVGCQYSIRFLALRRQPLILVVKSSQHWSSDDLARLRRTGTSWRPGRSLQVQ